MARHGMLRAPRTVAGHAAGDQRTHELPAGQGGVCQHLANPQLGYVSRYALGRDYHKLLRQRLKKLGDQIEPTAAS